MGKGTALSEFYPSAQRQRINPTSIMSNAINHGSEDYFDPHGQGMPLSKPETPMKGERGLSELVEKKLAENFRGQTGGPESPLDVNYPYAGAEVVKDPLDWTLPEVINFLEMVGVPKTGLEVCRERSATGRWLAHLFKLPEIHEILKAQFMMENPFERVQLLYQFESLCEDSKAAKALLSSPSIPDRKPSASPMMSPPRLTENHGTEPSMRLNLLGEKAVEIPSFPKTIGDKGVESINLQDWKVYTRSLSMWAAMVSTKYANLVDKIYENPDVTVDEKLLDLFTWQEVKLDKTLGLHIYTKCPTSIKKFMTKREDYELMRGHASGLKIIAYVGQKINRRSSDRKRSLKKDLAKRPPLRHISEMENELLEIQAIMDDIDHQGQRLSSEELQAVLLEMIDNLLRQVDLAVLLAQPVYGLLKTHPDDGYELLEVLKAISQQVTYYKMWSHLKSKKSHAQILAAAVQDENAKRRHQQSLKKVGEKPERIPGHIYNHPKGYPCINERDNGTCLLEKKGCKGTHGTKDHWKPSECTNPAYLQFQVCPGFIPGKKSDGTYCKHKHSKRPVYSELAKLREKATMQFAHMFAICEECDSEQLLALEVDEDVGHETVHSSTTSSPRDAHTSAVIAEVMMARPLEIMEHRESSVEEPSKTHTMPTMEEISAVVSIPDNAKILIDGGTCAHMFGTGVKDMLVNVRTLTEPTTIMTASGLSEVHEMADLHIGNYALLDGYVNAHMPTTLLSEGELQKIGWQFLGAGEHKVVMTPQGDFVAEKHGNLHFWSVRKTGLRLEKMELHPKPHIDHPVPPEFADQVRESLKRVRGDDDFHHWMMMADYTNRANVSQYDLLFALQHSSFEEADFKVAYLEGDTWQTHPTNPTYSTMGFNLTSPAHSSGDNLEESDLSWSSTSLNTWMSLDEAQAMAEIDMANVAIDTTDASDDDVPPLIAAHEEAMQAAEQGHLSDEDSMSSVEDSNDDYMSLAEELDEGYRSFMAIHYLNDVYYVHSGDILEASIDDQPTDYTMGHAVSEDNFSEVRAFTNPVFECGDFYAPETA